MYYIFNNYELNFQIETCKEMMSKKCVFFPLGGGLSNFPHTLPHKLVYRMQQLPGNKLNIVLSLTILSLNMSHTPTNNYRRYIS